MVKDCLTESEVNSLLNLARQRLSASDISSAHSSSLYLRNKTDADIPSLRRLARRAAEITGLSTEHFEAPSMTRYKTGQSYGLHFDSGFRIHGREVNRTATFLAYLSTAAPDQGGETVFPYAIPKKHDVRSSLLLNSLPSTGDNRPHLAEVCGKNVNGVLVRPLMGSCLLFYNHAQPPHNGVEYDEGVDRRSMHGSCPLQCGDKWIVQIWMHDQHWGAGLTDFWT